MKYDNEQKVDTSTTSKATGTEKIKPELTDDEIASVAGGIGGLLPPIVSKQPPGHVPPPPPYTPPGPVA